MFGATKSQHDAKIVLAANAAVKTFSLVPSVVANKRCSTALGLLSSGYKSAGEAKAHWLESSSLITNPDVLRADRAGSRAETAFLNACVDSGSMNGFAIAPRRKRRRRRSAR